MDSIASSGGRLMGERTISVPGSRGMVRRKDEPAAGSDQTSSRPPCSDRVLEGDRESEPGAADGALAGRVGAPEAVEHALGASRVIPMP